MSDQSKTISESQRLRSPACHEIHFIIIDKAAKQPYQAYNGDAGYDLHVSRETVIEPHAFHDVHVGIAIAMPPNIWGRITGRSSTIRKYGLQVQEGVIDSQFRGPLFVGVWNHTDMPVKVEVGSRLAQIIFHEVRSFAWRQVDQLPPSDRGNNGFGSSGV